MQRPTRRPRILRSTSNSSAKVRSTALSALQKYSFVLSTLAGLAVLSIWASVVETGNNRAPSSIRVSLQEANSTDSLTSMGFKGQKGLSLLNKTEHNLSFNKTDKTSETEYSLEASSSSDSSKNHLIYDKVNVVHELNIKPRERMSLYSTGKPLVIESLN